MHEERRNSVAIPDECHDQTHIPPAKSPEKNIDYGFDAPDTPWAALESNSQIPDGKPENVITVDDFLRWSAQTPQRRYRRKRRLYNKLQDLPRGDSHQSCIGVHPEYAGMSRHTRRCPIKTHTDHTSREVIGMNRTAYNTQDSRIHPSRNIRKTQPLASRILTAAVLSHVDPVQLSVGEDDDLHIGGRRPLKFVLADRLSMQETVSRTQKWKVIDPRKAAPLHDMPSPFASCALSLPLVRRNPKKPITDWQPAVCGYPSQPYLSGQKTKTEEATDGQSEQTDVVPLTFVSLEEHEAHLQRSHLPSGGRYLIYILIDNTDVRFTEELPRLLPMTFQTLQLVKLTLLEIPIMFRYPSRYYPMMFSGKAADCMCVLPTLKISNTLKAPFPLLHNFFPVQFSVL